MRDAETTFINQANKLGREGNGSGAGDRQFHETTISMAETFLTLICFVIRNERQVKEKLHYSTVQIHELLLP